MEVAKKTRNLVIYRDNQYPRYLQIRPSEAVEVMIPQYNIKNELIGHKPGRLSKAGTIDIVTIPDEPIEVGDQFRTSISIIQITNILERRSLRGSYTIDNASWMRCEFVMVQKTI